MKELLEEKLKQSGMLWVYELYEKGELLDDDSTQDQVFGWGYEVGYVEALKDIIDMLS